MGGGSGGERIKTPMTAPLAVDLKLSQQCSLARHQDKKLKKKFRVQGFAVNPK